MTRPFRFAWLRPAVRRGIPAAVAMLVLAVPAGRAEERPSRGKARAAVPAPLNVWTDEQFEQWAFNYDGDAATMRRRFDSQIALRVDALDPGCQLTDAQKAKLRLMGVGDVKRLYDDFDRAKQKFNELGNDRQKLAEVMPLVRPTQEAAQGGLFQRADCLLAKALRRTLTAEQYAKYAASEKERRAAAHRAKIELAVNALEETMPLRDAQRREVIALLVRETKPFRSSGGYDYYVLMVLLARQSEGKLKLILSETQWAVWNACLAQYKGFEPSLKAWGVRMDDEDEEDDAPAKK